MKEFSKIKSSRNIYLYVIFVWVIFVSMVMGFGLLYDIQKARENFRVQGASILNKINERTSINEAVLEGFSAIISASKEGDFDDIRTFAKYMQKRYPHIFKLEIVGKVKRENLDALTTMYKNIYGRFLVKSFDYSGDRKWHKVDKKDYYLPIIFMEPFTEEAKKIIGLDLETHPSFQSYFNKNDYSKLVIASVPFKLVQGPQAYLLHRIVTRESDQNGTNLLDESFAMLVLRADALIEEINIDISGYIMTLYHTQYDRYDKSGHLYQYQGSDKSSLEKLLFPLLVDERTVVGGAEQFSLYREHQMGWGSINWMLMFIVFIVGITSFWVLMFYAKQYHTNELKKMDANSRLFYLANHDELTGLANRYLMNDRLQHAMVRIKRNEDLLAIFFLDLNDFKLINDNYGHEVGDSILRKAAERLRASIREEDTLARRGGDEFMILVENLHGSDEILPIIEKIRAAFEQKFNIDGVEFNVGISVGTAIYPRQGKTIEELIKEADYSMYIDKERIKNDNK